MTVSKHLRGPRVVALTFDYIQTKILEDWKHVLLLPGLLQITFSVTFSYLATSLIPRGLHKHSVRGK